MSDEIERNLAIIKQRINDACIKSNRQPEEVRLLLATKTVPAERIKIALQAGHTLIAENAETEKVRKCFRLLKSIKQQIIALSIPNVEMTELSMGMYPDSYYWNEGK